MAWRDASGQGWNARRANGWPNDSKAPDGYTVAGFRRIDRHGRIRFAGSYWTHPRLLESVGRVVRVAWGGDPANWATQDAQVYFGHPDANPENYLEHHHSFYDWRSSVVCDSTADWNCRKVTKF